MARRVFLASMPRGRLIEGPHAAFLVTQDVLDFTVWRSIPSCQAMARIDTPCCGRCLIITQVSCRIILASPFGWRYQVWYGRRWV